MLLDPMHILQKILTINPLPNFPLAPVEIQDEFHHWLTNLNNIPNGQIRIASSRQDFNKMSFNLQNYSTNAQFNILVAHQTNVESLMDDVIDRLLKYKFFPPAGWVEATDGYYTNIKVQNITFEPDLKAKSNAIGKKSKQIMLSGVVETVWRF